MIRGTCAVKCRRASARGDLRRKEKYTETICGDNSEEETPVPIPNTEVKLLSADDTWWETAWESRTLPLIYLKTSLLFKLVFICFLEFYMRKGGNSVSLRLHLIYILFFIPDRVFN